MEARKQPDPMALTITLTPADVGAWSLQINDLQRKKRSPWAGLSTLLTFFAAMIASALLVTVIYWALDGNTW